MEITYILHSCYILEFVDTILIFDYYKGHLPNDLFNKNKKILVFSSHSHHDHFNATILGWINESNDITYILSNDIPKNDKNSYYLAPNETLILKDISIKTFESTDLGVSFLIEIGEFRIFHAGDLNWWHWHEESTKQYVEESRIKFVDILKKIKFSLGTKHLDVAMFPTDPRMGKYYYMGSQLFINIIQPRLFLPMHFDETKHNLKDFFYSMWCSESMLLANYPSLVDENNMPLLRSLAYSFNSFLQKSNITENEYIVQKFFLRTMKNQDTYNNEPSIISYTLEIYNILFAIIIPTKTNQIVFPIKTH